MANTDTIWVTISRYHRQVRVYAAGTDRVRSIQCNADAVATSPQGAEVSLTAPQARCFQDLLAATTGYYPEDPDLDRQRTRLRERAAELQVIRGDGEPDPAAAALAELALSRHVGIMLAEVAHLVTQAYDHTGDRTVSEMLSELGLIIEAMLYASTLTNPEGRIDGHLSRIDSLSEQLPRQGAPT
jgi:hypothetical protein